MCIKSAVESHKQNTFATALKHLPPLDAFLAVKHVSFASDLALLWLRAKFRGSLVRGAKIDEAMMTISYAQFLEF